MPSAFSFPTAFAPFFAFPVSIHAECVESGVRKTATQRVRASVSSEGATPDALGADVDSHGVTVEFPATEWTGDVPLTPGSWIEADSATEGRRLTIQTVTKVGGIYHLICSAKEGAPRHA